MSDLRFFEELGTELDRAASRTLADSADPEPTGRGRRPRRSIAPGVRAAPVGLAVAVTLAVAVGAFLLIGGVRHKPSPAPPPVAVTPPGLPPGPSPGLSPEQRYIDNAWLKVQRQDPGCVPRQPALAFSDRAPSRALLSSLGVLRLPAAPATAEFVFGHLNGAELGTPVYRRYVQLARVATVTAPASAGGLVRLSYYVLPAGNVIGTVPPAARCYPEQAAALQAELTRARASLRGSTIRLAAQERHDDEHPEGIGVQVLAGGSGGAGGGPGDAYAGTTSEVEQRGVMGAAIPAGSATVVSGVVPDRVAKVTLDYPRVARAGHAARAFSVSARPLNNVFVASLPRGFGVTAPDTITWRAADGAVIKVIHPNPGASGS